MFIVWLQTLVVNACGSW